MSSLWILAIMISSKFILVWMKQQEQITQNYTNLTTDCGLPSFASLFVKQLTEKSPFVGVDTQILQIRTHRPQRYTLRGMNQSNVPSIKLQRLS